MDKKSIMKVISIIAMIGGAGLSLIADLLNDKVSDMELDERIDERLAARDDR